MNEEERRRRRDEILHEQKNAPIFSKEDAEDACRERRFLPDADARLKMIRVEEPRGVPRIANGALVDGVLWLGESEYRQMEYEKWSGDPKAIAFPEGMTERSMAEYGNRLLTAYRKGLSGVEAEATKHLRLSGFGFWHYYPKTGTPRTEEVARLYDPELFDGPEVSEKVLDKLRHPVISEGDVSDAISRIETKGLELVGNKTFGWPAGDTFFFAPESIVYYVTRHGIRPRDANFLAFCKYVDEG